MTLRDLACTKIIQLKQSKWKSLNLQDLETDQIHPSLLAFQKHKMTNYSYSGKRDISLASKEPM